MIRINLLPIKKQQEKESGKRQLVVFAIILLAQVAIMYGFYSWKGGELTDVTSENTRKAAEIETLKKDVADIEKLTKEKGVLQEQLGVLDTLQQGRSGPVRVLDEVIRILSAPATEFEKVAFEKENWDPNWDPSRLWFNSLLEEGGAFRLEGGARTSDDVAEFLQRLASSVFFEAVRLESLEQTEKDGFKYVVFEITGRITYSLAAPAAPGTKG